MTSRAPSRPAAFVDRDGVLNRRPGRGHVLRAEDLDVLPHAAEGLVALRALGYAIVVVTNQRAVALGTLAPAELGRIHARLTLELARGGATVDRIEHCPHDDQDGCACRKPRPGMLLRAAEALGLDVSRSVLIGDDPRDLAAAEAAGVPVRVLLPSDGDLRVAVDEVRRRAGIVPPVA
ncbi:MAG: HAD-IIIA family hydrolase [Planctomycetes bacterium]|nr:HAD-IIIA family hydrolase [Planctomycetota bacterium]